jgi:hypothetical protein
MARVISDSDRATLDARLARLLADALLRDLRAELARETNAPHLQAQAGASDGHDGLTSEHTTTPT